MIYFCFYSSLLLFLVAVHLENPRIAKCARLNNISNQCVSEAWQWQDRTIFILRRNSWPHTFCCLGVLTTTQSDACVLWAVRCVRQCFVTPAAKWKVEFSVSSLDSRYEGYQPRQGQGRNLHSQEVSAEFMACLDDPETREREKAGVIKTNTVLQLRSEQVAKQRETQV